MPRDSQGHPFGIGSCVRTPDGGTITVSGFVVASHDLTREQVSEIARISSSEPVRSYYWHEVELEHPENDPYKHHDHTDLCRMDAAQANGLTIPKDREGVKDIQAMVALTADKAIWGP